MTRSRSVALGLIVAALVLVPVLLVLGQRPAAASSTVLTIFAGDAQVARANAGFVAAADGDLVAPGDRVRTEERSHAVVTFFDGSTLVLEPSTTVTIEDASARGDAISIRLSQAIGRTWASVHKLRDPGSRFEVRTPTSTAVVRGTGFLTDVRADGSSSVHTTDGTVEVSAQGQTVQVRAGQLTTVALNAPPSTPVAAPRPVNRLRFGLHSPALLTVIDPLGRACGLVLPGPVLARQIPGCLVTDVGVEPQLIDVPDAAGGAYSLVILPRGSGGPYTLTASAVSGTSLSFDLSLAGAIAGGETQVTALEVSRAADGTLTSSGLAPISTTLRSPLKVAVPSARPSPDVGARPTTSVALFPPLPSSATPSPTPSPVTTPSPAVILSPSPSPAPPPTTVPPAPSTSSPTPTLTPVSPTPTPTSEPTPTPTPRPTSTPTPTPTSTFASSPLATGTPTPTATPAPEPAASATPRPRLERGCELGANPGHGAGGADQQRCLETGTTTSSRPSGSGGSSPHTGSAAVTN